MRRAGGPRPRSGLVGGQVARSSWGRSSLKRQIQSEMTTRASDGVELLAIEALVPEAGVKGFDVAVLPGRIGVDVEGACRDWPDRRGRCGR